jgi:hypothetical protein
MVHTFSIPLPASAHPYDWLIQLNLNCVGKDGTSACPWTFDSLGLDFPEIPFVRPTLTAENDFEKWYARTIKNKEFLMGMEKQWYRCCKLPPTTTSATSFTAPVEHEESCPCQCKVGSQAVLPEVALGRILPSPVQWSVGKGTGHGCGCGWEISLPRGGLRRCALFFFFAALRRRRHLSPDPRLFLDSHKSPSPSHARSSRFLYGSSSVHVSTLPGHPVMSCCQVPSCRQDHPSHAAHASSDCSSVAQPMVRFNIPTTFITE